MSEERLPYLTSRGPAPAAPDADLLQAFEHLLEEIARLSAALRSVVETMQRGEQLPDDVLTSYLEQLETVARDRARLVHALPMLWQLLGHGTRH